MGFVCERISEEDRKKFDLDRSDKWLSLAVPSREWAIDHDSNTFIRVLRLHGRKNEPGDFEARYERDFHFHCGGRDFIVFTRAAIDPDDYDGTQFGDLEGVLESEWIFAYRVWGIWEVSDAGVNRRFGIECRNVEFFNSLRDALLARVCCREAPTSSARGPASGRVILKVSDKVEDV